MLKQAVLLSCRFVTDENEHRWQANEETASAPQETISTWSE